MRKSHKIVKELFSEKRINSASLSFLEISKETKLEAVEVEKEIDSISWFLSLATLNSTFIPVYQYFNNSGNLFKIEIKEHLTLPCHNLSLFDNKNDDTRLISFFQSSYDIFNSKRAILELDKVISMLLEMQPPHTLENKFASLIMAYEFFLKRYLIDNGIAESTVREWNVLQKIQQANKFLRFIPAALLSDDLRANIRNPLFHQGDIPDMNIQEKYECFSEYWNLFVRIILRILNYSGKYYSRKDYTVVDV